MKPNEVYTRILRMTGSMRLHLLCQVVCGCSCAPSGRRAGPLTRPRPSDAARGPGVWRVLGDESAVMDRGGGEFVSRLDHTEALTKWARVTFPWGAPGFCFLRQSLICLASSRWENPGKLGRSLLYTVGLLTLFLWELAL